MLSRKILRIILPLALALSVALVWWLRVPRVNASLYDLIGSEARRIPFFLREASASDVALVVSSADAEKARAAAQKLVEEFPVSADLPPGALAFLRANRGGLATSETAELLRTREGRAKVAKRAVRRLYTSPIPPILGCEDDPFGLADAWLLSLARARTAKTPEGWPSLATNGVTRILLRHRLAADEVADIDRTIGAIEKLEERIARLDGADGMSPHRCVSVCLAGAPVHAVVSARRCKAEMGWLTGLSLAVIAALALFVFRSLRWLPLFACSLFVSALAGVLALVACFREIHVMTLVMGTTVLGLVIDYSFHWLLSPEEAKTLVRKNLFVSFLTTEISLVPLMLASIPVLRQSAVFLGVGLAAALGYVLVCYPVGEPSNVGAASCRTSERESSSFWCGKMPHLRVGHGFARVGGALLLLIVLAGLFRVSVRTDVRALYRPPTALAEAERQRAQFGEFDFSALPSLEERRANAARIRLLYGEHGAKLGEAIGVRPLPVPPEPTERLMRPQDLMDEIFGVWTKDSLRRLLLAILALVAAVACFFRGRSPRILAPPVLALLFVAGTLGWAGTPVNLFHILAAFLLLGMGIDYAVFLQSGDRTAFRPALCSLLTSVAGFGALAFVSFPVVRSFGVVLGVGLPVAFVAALLAGEAVARPVDAIVPIASNRSGTSLFDAFETNASAEHGASLIGMEILFFLYRLFGIRVLHLFAALVGLCVWLSSSAVRRASPSVKKVVFFTRSLADKFVVLADGRDLPRVETDGSSGAAAFVEDVRSGRGVFVLSSHVGTIEMLTALGECDRTFHAWMDFDRTSVFNRFYLRHAKRSRVKIHPISEFGMQTVFEAGDWIDGGDCLVMAGDRGEGAFRFAAAFDHPVYFVACLAERGCRYCTMIRRLPGNRTEMETAYDAIRERLASEFKNQCFDWFVV